MKTIVSVLISILIMIQMSTPAMAASITPTDSSPAMVGYMTNEEGISIKIHGELLEAQAVHNQDDTYSATYLYRTPIVSGSNTTDSPDSGYSSHVYLTIKYKVKDSRHFLLTSISGYREIQDSRVSVTKSKIDYISGVKQFKNDIKASNHFNKTTGFTEYTEDDGTFSDVGAELKLKYLMGDSRTWSFSLNNFVL